MKKLNSANHSEIRIATGALRTSPIPSLYNECGIPPLSLKRDKLVANYVIKIAASPLNPVFDILYNQLLPVQLFSVNKPKPLSLRYKQQSLLFNHLSYSDVLPFANLIPPWLGKRDLPYIDKSLTVVKKGSTAPSMYNQKFLELINTEHDAANICYTDGSKSPNSTSCAFSFNGSITSHTLNPINSIFPAELIAILLCLMTIMNSPPNRFVVASDSLSALLAISNPEFSCPIIPGIYSCWSELIENDKLISLVWCPSHCDIPGNETVDKAEKNPLNRTPLKLCSL